MNAARAFARLGAIDREALLLAVPIGIGSAAIYTGAQIAIPLTMGAIIDRALLAHDVAELRRLALILVGAALVTMLTRGAQTIVWAWLEARNRARLQASMLERLYRLPQAAAEDETSGRLHSLFVQDAATASRLWGDVLSEASLGVLQLAGLLGVLTFRYGTVALAALVLIPAYLVIPGILSRPLRQSSRQALKATGEVALTLQESIQGLRDIKVLGRQGWAVHRLNECTDKHRAVQLKAVTLQATQGINYVLYFSAAALAYWLGGRRVFAGTLSVGDLVAMVTLLAYLEGPASRLARLGMEYQSVCAALDRILTRFAGAQTAAEAEGQDLDRVGHSLSFEHVTFSYPTAGDSALRDLTFTIQPGQHVAVVGPSGAGKSTLVALLAGLYQPNEGRILIDGTDRSAYSEQSLRRELGFVLQEPMLFSGTVADNIRLGRLTASDEEVRVSAVDAEVDPFVNDLPCGYETEIGERGARLSGGQRQRIGIARTLLRNPAILVLDEAMSALDSRSEHLVRRSFTRLMAGRTTLQIAHRPSSFVEADEILVLDAGRLVAKGKHHDLLVRCEVYRDLVGQPRSADGEST